MAQLGKDKNKGNLKLLQKVQDYLGNNDLASSGLAGNWSLKNDRFIDVGPEVGRLLGLPKENLANGSASLSLNDLAGLAMMFEDPKSGLSQDQRKGFDKLMSQMGQYAGSTDAYKHFTANPNRANLNILLNSAMAGQTGAAQQAYTTPPATPYPISKWATEYAPTASSAGGYGPGGNWTYNQMRQYDSVSNFLGYWPKLDSPTTQAELTKAVASGMTANQIERALYQPDTDTQGVLRNTSKQFQAAFPALVKAYQSGQPIAPSSVYEYNQLAEQYQAAVRQYGLAPLSNSKIADLMTNHIRPQDLTARAQMAVESYNYAPQAVKDALQNQYGITPQMAVNYILDPTKGIDKIKDELTGANLIATGARAGVTKDDATRLTQLMDNPVGNVTAEQVNNAVQQANQLSYLQQPTVGKQEGTQTTASAQDVLGANVAGFSTDQVAQQEKINKALQERQQASLAGGQMLTDQSGVKGAYQIQ